MIDFISTNPSADQQTVACARLLAAVIAQAVEDASNKGSSASDQAAAIDWLFDKSSRFTSYAALIGMDAEAMRQALLAPHNPSSVEPMHGRFDEGRRRNVRIAHAKWLERKKAEQAALQQMKS